MLSIVRIATGRSDSGPEARLPAGVGRHVDCAESTPLAAGLIRHGLDSLWLTPYGSQAPVLQVEPTRGGLPFTCPSLQRTPAGTALGRARKAGSPRATEAASE